MQPAAILPRANSRRRSVNNRLVRERIIRLLRTEIDFISNKSFRTIDREFERQVLEDRFQVAGPVSAVPRSLPAHLARLCESGMLTPEEEQELFRRMNYLKYRANVLRSRLSPHAPDESMLEKVERFLAAAHAIRDHIIKANMRLVISVVKKFVTPQHSFDEMLSDGIYSLDAGRGQVRLRPWLSIQHVRVPSDCSQCLSCHHEAAEGHGAAGE